jgi:8-oxo-dGTP pyrophosphatase MutT (NUDIX family)
VAAVGPSDRQVLLVKGKDVEVWTSPGGMVEPGEATSEAAVRETREETGPDAPVACSASIRGPDGLHTSRSSRRDRWKEQCERKRVKVLMWASSIWTGCRTISCGGNASRSRMR